MVYHHLQIAISLARGDRLSFCVARRRCDDGVEISVDLRAALETQGSLASAVTTHRLPAVATDGLYDA